MKLVLEAAEFAAVAHHGQVRGGSGEPYVAHCLSVAKRLTAVGVADPEVLAAAILHDVLEDTAASPTGIESLFGSRVLLYVLQLTLPSEIQTKKDYVAKVEYQKSKMREMDFFGRAIKIADKTSNVEDLVDDPPKWSKQAMLGYTRSSEMVVDAAFAPRETPPEFLVRLASEFYRASSGVHVRYG